MDSNQLKWIDIPALEQPTDGLLHKIIGGAA